MNLLNVYIIFTYFESVSYYYDRKNKLRIKNLRLNNTIVCKKLERLKYHLTSALHWNEQEAKSISRLFEKAIRVYKELEKDLQITLIDQKTYKKRYKAFLKILKNFQEVYLREPN